MKTATKRIILLLWLAIAAFQLLLSAPIASAKQTIGLENRAWEIFPLAAQSHQAERAHLSEAQRERAPPQRTTAPGDVLEIHFPDFDSYWVEPSNAPIEWLVHGPDLTGGYGDLQGTGGIDAVVNPSASTATGIISDLYGQVEATVSGTTVNWNPVLCTSYGPEPGLTAEPLDGTHDLSTFLAWRSKYVDPSGFYYLGNRYYDPQSGTFISPDPLGHAASMDLYQAFGADPVNYFDPRGLIASNFLNNANDNPNSAENQAYAENSLASDASLPPSFYRGLGHLVTHTLQGLIQLPGATVRSASAALTFSTTLVTDPGAAWNETQQTITQIPQDLLSSLDLIRQTSATPEGRAELLGSVALFATPFLESNVARAAAATESIPGALAPTGELAAETGVLQTRNFTQIQSMAQSGRLAISDQALGLLGQLPRSGSSVVVDSSFSLQALAELQNAAQVEFGLFEVGDANVLVRGTRFEVGVPKNATSVIAHSHLHEYLCVAPQSG